MWLYNRDNTIAEHEKVYFTAIHDEATDIVFSFVKPGQVDADTTTADLSALLQNDDGVSQRIAEQADSAAIYTADAEMMCMVSSNAGAFEDEMGEKPESVEQKAYYAYEVDLRELLFSEHFLEGMLAKLQDVLPATAVLNP